MLTHSIANNPPAVNTQLTDDQRATLRAAGVRVYTHHATREIGLEKRCPHCDYDMFVTADTDDVLHHAITWYTDPAFACPACRERREREATERARAHGPNLLTIPVGATRRGCPPSGRPAPPRPRKAAPRPRAPKRASEIVQWFTAYDLTRAFLAAVAQGETTATDQAIRNATTLRDRAERALRRLGAI